ncbi:MAG: PAS domain-containing protein [bacterium]|nr:PAS domain-containing protein [bacterium]
MTDEGQTTGETKKISFFGKKNRIIEELTKANNLAKQENEKQKQELDTRRQAFEKQEQEFEARKQEIETLKAENATLTKRSKGLQNFVNNLEKDSDRLAQNLTIANSIKNGIAEPFFTVDLSYTITHINQACADIIGYSAADVVGKMKCSDIFKSNICKGDCVIKECIEKKTSKSNQEVEITIRGGEKIPIMASAGALCTSLGEPIGGYEMFRDIRVLKGILEPIKEIAKGKLEVPLVKEKIAAGMDLEAASRKTTEDILGSKTMADVNDPISFALYEAFLSMGINLRKIAVQADAIAKDDLSNPLLDIKIEGELGQTFSTMIETLRHRSHQAHTIALGDLKNEALDIIGKGDLSSSFALMIENLRKLSAQAEAIANGHLYAEVLDQNIPGHLGESFSRMTSSLRNLVLKVKDSANMVSANANEIMAATTQIATGAETQARRISESSAAVTQLSASIQEVSKSNASSSKRSQEAITVAGSGCQQVAKTITGMNRIKQTVDDTAQKILELGKSGHEIGKIVKVISGIAEQTNLLALNAAIEAARAGEQGRGFAVVADQVGKLAERTARSTKEIGELIERIQVETNECVEAMKIGIKVVEDGTTLADEAGDALNEIKHVVEENSAMINEIAIASGEQAGASDEISSRLTDISEISRDTSKSCTTGVEQTEKLLKISLELSKQVAYFELEKNPLNTLHQPVS